LLNRILFILFCRVNRRKMFWFFFGKSINFYCKNDYLVMPQKVVFDLMEPISFRRALQTKSIWYRLK
jgi:hypothetical protein